MTNRLLLGAMAILALVGAVRVLMYFDGFYEDGEIVNGEAVGKVVGSCAPATDLCDVGPNGMVLCLEAIKERCVRPVDLLIAEQFPDGPPSPVTRVTGHDEPPLLLPWAQAPTYLAGHGLTVITLADGSRRVVVSTGIGPFLELRDPASVQIGGVSPSGTP